MKSSDQYVKSAGSAMKYLQPKVRMSLVIQKIRSAVKAGEFM
jgi:hypothetical protein